MLLPLEIQINEGKPGMAARRVKLAPPADDATHLVGADASSAVRLESNVVSPTHAEFLSDGTHWCIRDLASAGGTFIDDNRLFATAIRLEVDQRIRLGSGESAAHITVRSGAASPRDGVDVAREVSSFVKQQKRERKRLPMRWKVAVPSIGAIAILVLWASSAMVVAHRRAALRDNPNLAQSEHDDGATGRLAAIMSGEARPEDVNVQQIIKDASLGRGSSILNAAIDAGRSVMSGNATMPLWPSSEPVTHAAPQAASSADGPAAVDRSLPTLIARTRHAGGAERAALDTQIAQQSRAVTLQRLGRLLDERQRLITRAFTEPLSAAEAARMIEIDQRLGALNIDPTAVQWQPGGDEGSLAGQIDPAVLERVRQKLVAAMSRR